MLELLAVKRAALHKAAPADTGRSREEFGFGVAWTHVEEARCRYPS